MNMTDGAAPLLRVALRDGSTLTVASDAVRLESGDGSGGETIALDRMQDARQIAPEPPTFALRVAGRRLLEFQPANPDEGPLALEAIYRLRPDLRPAGFESPAATPEWWPRVPSASNGWMPLGSNPLMGERSEASFGGSRYPTGDGAGMGAVAAPPYQGGPSGTTPYPAPPLGFPSLASPLAARPRDPFGLVADTFRLFRAHWRRWLLLGLIASAPPAVVSGALQMAFYGARGVNPWRGLDTSAIGIWPTRPPSAPQLAGLIVLVVASLVVWIVSVAWQAAVLGVAGDDALRGQPVDTRSSLERGARRFVAVLLVTLASLAAPVVAMSAPLVLAVAVAAPLEGTNPNAAPNATILAATSVVCLSLLLFVALLVVGIYVMIRLFVAPYLAATEPLGVRSALAATWRLTGGRGGLRLGPSWRPLVSVLIVLVIEVLVTAPLGNVELASYALASLVVNPLSVCVTGPLTSLALVVALRELRLRGARNPNSP